MSRAKDQPRSFTAEVHMLFSGYVEVVPPPALGHIASTVSFVRDVEIRVIIDPGLVPHLKNILEPLAALGESPASITDVIFSHHHPDHTLNAALFPYARFHDYWAIYKDDTWLRRDARCVRCFAVNSADHNAGA